MPSIDNVCNMCVNGADDVKVLLCVICILTVSRFQSVCDWSNTMCLLVVLIELLKMVICNWTWQNVFNTLASSSIMQAQHKIYHGPEKKHVSVFSYKILVFLNRFLLFLYCWKLEWILYKEVTNIYLHLNCDSTLPGKTENNTKTADRFLHCILSY